MKKDTWQIKKGYEGGFFLENDNFDSFEFYADINTDAHFKTYWNGKPIHPKHLGNQFDYNTLSKDSLVFKYMNDFIIDFYFRYEEELKELFDPEIYSFKEDKIEFNKYFDSKIELINDSIGIVTCFNYENSLKPSLDRLEEILINIDKMQAELK